MAGIATGGAATSGPVPAALLFSLGVGFLLATFVSYKLAGRMHAGAPDAGLTRP